MATRYVRQGATGSNNGTDWTNAYTTLSGATLNRGDLIYVADGTYAGRTFSTATSGTTVITIQKATVSDHGTSTGWDNTYGDGTAFFGAFSFTSDYWVINGVTGGGPGSWKTGFGFQIDYTTSSPGISCEDVGNITISHIAIIGPQPNGAGGTASTDGLYFRSPGAAGNGNFTISYYYMDDLGLAPFSAIPIAQRTGSTFIAEYGYVGSFYGTEAAHSELASIWDDLNGTVIFRYNIFGFVTSTGGIMWDNSTNNNARLDIYGNVFWKDPAYTGFDNSANGIIGGWSGFDFANVHVYNNTFVNITGSEVLSTFPNGINTEARNNLFYTCNNPGGGGTVWITVSHNHFISTTTVGTNTTTGTGDPFTNLNGMDFRLTSNTTAGTTLSAPYNTDMYGNTRTTWTRGAIEFQSSTSPTIALFLS